MGREKGAVKVKMYEAGKGEGREREGTHKG